MSASPERSGWGRLWPAAAYQFAFVAAAVLLKSAANAQVLARFRAEALPYLYLCGAALTAVVTTFLAYRTRHDDRFGPVSQSLWGALVAVVLAAGVSQGVGPAPLLSYLFIEVFSTFASVVFWAAAARAFDPREQRHAFTLLSGMGMAGGMAGGLGSQLLARAFGAGVLPYVAAAVLALGALALRRQTYLPEEPRSARRFSAEDARDVWGYLRAHPFARTLALFVLALAMLSAMVDFLFRHRAAQALGEDELAALFGNLQLWVGVLSAGFQFLWAGRLLERMGILRYLTLVPLVLLTLSGVALVSEALWPAYLLKLAENAISFSILPVAVQLLYSPVADGLRDRFRGVMDGFVRKGGLALAGLLLAGVGTLAEGIALPVGLVLLSFGAGALLLRLRPAYLTALQERVAGPSGATPTLDISATEPLLAAELQASVPDRALRALTVMEEVGIPLRPHLATLLQHPHERVAERGVQLAVTLAAEEALPYVERLVAGEARRPRDEAVWALGRLSPDRARAQLPALLGSEDVGLRCAAIGALLSLGPHAEASAALESLTRLRRNVPSLAERREVARLLGRLGEERYAEKLARYLEDGDGSVRRVAIAAVGQGRYVSLAPRLLPFLTWRDDRRTAREALAEMGDAVLPLLEQALNDRSRAALLRYELPRVLRQLGTQAALEALLFSNVRDDAFLHYRIGVALARLKEEQPGLSADEGWVMEALGRRREVYRRLREPFLDLGRALGPHALLTRAVGDRLDQAYEISFWLLGLLHSPKQLRRIHQHLVGGDPRRRAWALELFENLVPEAHRERVREQTEQHHRLTGEGTEGRLSVHLALLCHSDDGVLRACARKVARDHGLWSLPPQEDDMSEALVRKMFALEGVEMFAQSDVDDLSAVAALAREQSFRKGERVYELGDPGDALYVILEGKVRAERHGEEVLTLGEKEAFGAISLLDGSPRPTSVSVLEDAKLLVIERRDFLDLISDRPELLKGVFRAAMRQYAHVLQEPRRNTGEVPKAG